MKFESILFFFALIVVAIDAAVRGTNSSSNRRLLHNENSASASSRYQRLANAIIESSLNKGQIMSSVRDENTAGTPTK